eukprot:gene13186-22889_t
MSKATANARAGAGAGAGARLFDGECCDDPCNEEDVDADAFEKEYDSSGGESSEYEYSYGKGCDCLACQDVQKDAACDAIEYYLEDAYAKGLEYNGYGFKKVQFLRVEASDDPSIFLLTAIFDKEGGSTKKTIKMRVLTPGKAFRMACDYVRNTPSLMDGKPTEASVTSSDGKRIPQDSTGNAEQPHLPVFQCNGDSTVYDATLSTIDFMPPLWPKAPRWPYNRKLQYELLESIGMIHVFYADWMLTSAISQRDADSRWRHFIMLCNTHPADQTKLGSEWIELLTSPSGYSFPYAANEVYSRQIFQTLVTDTMHKDPLYVPPEEQIPVICDADDCTNTCTSECMCGEVWCSRECMKKDWGSGHPVNGHRHICEAIFDNSSLAAVLTRMEMMKYLPAIDYAQSFGVNPKPKPNPKPPSEGTPTQQNFTVQEATYRQMVQDLLDENDEERSPKKHALFKKELTKPPGKVFLKPPGRNITTYSRERFTKDTMFALVTRTPNITKAAALCMAWQEPLALGTVGGKQEACRIVATAVLTDEKGCSALHHSDLDSLYAAGKEVIQDASSSADQKADAHVALSWTGIIMKVKRPHSESIEHFTKAIGFRPSSARQLELRAAFLAGTNQYNLALNDLRKVVELLADDENKMLNVYHPISKCLFQLDRNEDGIQALRKFLRCNPETGADVSWKRFEYTFTATDPDAIRFCEGMYELAFQESRNHKSLSCAQDWVDRAVEFERVNSGQSDVSKAVDVTLEEFQPKCQTTKAARSPECLDTPQETWVKGSWTKALCWTCGKRGKFKCVGCWMGRYCDKTCQKEGWRHDGHKAECDGLGKRKTKRREAKKLARAERTADQQMASSGGGGGGLKSQPL